MKNYRIFIAIVVICAFVFPVQGQLTKPELKIYKKSEKLYKKKKYEEAADLFEPVVENHPSACNVWGQLLKYRQGAYFYGKNPFANMGFTVKVSGSDTNEAAKRMAEELAELLMNSGKLRYVGALKSLVLKCEDDRTAQIYLRVLTVDKWNNPDTGIDKEAFELCQKAETYFAQANYDESIKYFKKALAKEPEYMQAIVHLGDCYYMQKRYDKSIEYFKAASLKWPRLLEPQKYLTDALLAKGDNDEAMEASINGIMRYPDDDMFARYAKASRESTGKFDRRWIGRWAPVAGFKKQYYYVAEQPQGDWEIYASAKNDIRQFCDTATGIINKENTVTTAKYLEVYAWEKMLKTATGEEFEFAKKMQKLGYLDCYVLISLFQVDLYLQQQDFVAKNPDKVKEYLKILIKDKD